MPTLSTHIFMALLFGGLFLAGQVLPDLDHLIKCSPKNVAAAALTENKDPEYNIQNQAVGGCRGFTHNLWFIIAVTGLYAGFIIHVIMDRFGSIGGI